MKGEKKEGVDKSATFFD